MCVKSFIFSIFIRPHWTNDDDSTSKHFAKVNDKLCSEKYSCVDGDSALFNS
jgi:hypothetical protein